VHAAATPFGLSECQRGCEGCRSAAEASQARTLTGAAAPRVRAAAASVGSPLAPSTGRAAWRRRSRHATLPPLSLGRGSCMHMSGRRGWQQQLQHADTTCSGVQVASDRQARRRASRTTKMAAQRGGRPPPASSSAGRGGRSSSTSPAHASSQGGFLWPSCGGHTGPVCVRRHISILISPAGAEPASLL
jgi:hypothetical protein